MTIATPDQRKEDAWEIVNKWRVDRRLLDQAFITTSDCQVLINRITTALEATAKSAREDERERCSRIAARHVIEGHNGQKCGTPGTLSCGIVICAAIAAEPEQG